MCNTVSYNGECDNLLIFCRAYLHGAAQEGGSIFPKGYREGGRIS